MQWGWIPTRQYGSGHAQGKLEKFMQVCKERRLKIKQRGLGFLVGDHNLSDRGTQPGQEQVYRRVYTVEEGALVVEKLSSC